MRRVQGGCNRDGCTQLAIVGGDVFEYVLRWAGVGMESSPAMSSG